MEQITRSQFLAIPKAYRGVYSDVQGVHPEWKGRRTAFLPGHGTTLFIEGVSFEIVDEMRKSIMPSASTIWTVEAVR